MERTKLLLIVNAWNDLQTMLDDEQKALDFEMDYRSLTDFEAGRRFAYAQIQTFMQQREEGKP